MERYVLGLDIGIGSVGWGIIDEELNIIDAGVRIFPEANKENNAGRRNNRGSRRRLRRRNHRLDRVKTFLINNNIIDNNFSFIFTKEITPYHLRVKGLTSKLTKEELAIVLYHLTKRRGIGNIDVIDKEELKVKGQSTKDIVGLNTKKLSGRYVCELQLEWLNTSDLRIRGIDNRFTTEQYLMEVNRILDTQMEFGLIDMEFKDKFIDIYNSKRKYYDGPGYPSPFGWDGDVEKWMTNMMGRCSYFPDEKRIEKNSYTALIFNLLNDLNNINVNGEKLTRDEKELIVNEVFKETKATSGALKKISKILNVEEVNIKGYRIDKNSKPNFTELTIYHDIKKIINDSSYLEDKNFIDAIAHICTIYQEEEDKKNMLMNELNICNADADKIKKLNYSGTHSLSKKAIDLILDDLWETSKNQQELFTELKLRPAKMNFTDVHRIPTNFIDEWILSPVVKRSLTQSIRIINAVIGKYGYPMDITIELAREKNSDDAKKYIEEMQKKNKNTNDDVSNILIHYNQKNKRLAEKIKLYLLQQGKCMYSLRKIEIDELINDYTKFEVDHIIPKSVSFDNSINNKVLVYYNENQKKGNMVPYQYFKSGKASITYEQFKNYVLNIKDSKLMSKKKQNYLLEERDINKWDVRKEFINRNLVDTRYATRELMNLLKLFFKDNEIPTKVKCINGSFTSYLRKVWNIPKDRDFFKNHAEDALIIAMSQDIFTNMNTFKLLDDSIEGTEVRGNVSIISNREFDSNFKKKTLKVGRIKSYKDFKYSHRVDKKPNRQLMNETIYSTRKLDDGRELIVEKIKNIYDSRDERLGKFFSNKNSYQKFLCYLNDPKTFEELMKIYQEYKEFKNPFAKYKEVFGEIRKYSKKGNGPYIKSLKYYGTKIGNHIDISHKYENTSENKRVILQSIKPYRMDVYYSDEDKIYKFISVTHNMVIPHNNKYSINEKMYKVAMERKKITENYYFKFSLNRGDIIKIDGEELVFKSVNDDKNNKIEVDYLHCKYAMLVEKKVIKSSSKQYVKTIKKSIIEFKKIYMDILGNRYICNEKIKWFL